MTRVIRNAEGLYFRQGGGWTAHFDQAEKFQEINSVISALLSSHLQGVNLVLMIQDEPRPGLDVVLPLTG